MEQLWQHLLHALAQLSPDLVQSLRPGVSEHALQEAEQRLSIVFPEELRVYFRLHNGSLGPLFGSWSLLSLEDLYENWYLLKRKAQDEQHRYQTLSVLEQTYPSSLFRGPYPITIPPTWKRPWVPLMRSGRFEGQYTWLVFDAEQPSPGDDPLAHMSEGTQRLFYYPPLLDDLTYPSSATSIAQVLQRLIEAVEAGVYLYELQTGGLRTLTFTAPLPRLHEPTLYEVLQQHPETLSLFKERLVSPSLCCTSYSMLSTEHALALHEQTIEQSWMRLRTALGTLAPPLEADLRPGAREEELKQCEAMLGRRLPEDVRTLYSLCNGIATVGESGFKGLFDMWSWYDLASLLWKWQWEREQREEEMHPLSEYPAPDVRIQAVDFHPAWIPFMVHEDESMLCIDLAPTVCGQQGQIILVHYPSSTYQSIINVLPRPPLVWVAPSLRVFLATLAQDILLGKYIWSACDGMLWSKEGFSYMTEDEGARYKMKDRRLQLLYPTHQEPPFDPNSLFEMEPPM